VIRCTIRNLLTRRRWPASTLANAARVFQGVDSHSEERHMPIRKFAIAGLVGLLLTGGPEATYAQARNDSLLVTTRWLAERLDEPSLVIIHVGNEATYETGHIPGARYLGYDAFTERRGRLYTELPALQELDRVLEEIGVSTDSRIVIYQPRGVPTMAGRLFVTLEYLGLGHRTSILDGGLAAWNSEGRPTTTDVPVVLRGSLSVRPQQDVVVDHRYVMQRYRDPSVAVLDARDRQYYTGEAGVTMHAFRPGHIPGAGSVPFSGVTDSSGRFKSRPLLRSMFSKAGAAPDKHVVTYCHLGQQASLLYFVARYLGYDSRMYDGSFEDWSARDDLPVEGPGSNGARR
jgi:thiosulfate/3-mercaptopyruvate sulfurtransferase